MNINDLRGGGKFLGAQDLEAGDMTLTIKSIEVRKLGRGDRAETKPVLSFRESDRQLPLNRTNLRAIGKIHGEETDFWIGKKITVYLAQVDFQGDQVPGVRIRLPQMGTSAPSGQSTGTTQTPRPAPNQRAENFMNNTTAPDPRVVRREAWQKFLASNPALQSDVAADRYRALASKYFGGRPSDSISAREWTQFITDGFTKPVIDDPLANAPEEFKDDDIPF